MNIAVLADSQNHSKEAEAIREALKKGDHTVEIYDVNQQIMATLKAKRPDLCCIAAGTEVDTGALQEMLELLQIPYLGSGSESCRISADEKISMFSLLRYVEAAEEELAVEPLVGFKFSAKLIASELDTVVQVCEERIPGGYPYEVRSLALEKTATTTVQDSKEFKDALKACEKTGCLVRQWVEGIRVSVAVLETGWDAHVLPPIDETKNAPVSLVALSSSDEVAQAIRSEIERCAFEVCLALGLRDFALVRLVWDGAQVRMAEVETLPSFAEGSAFEVACKTAGLSIEGVLNHLVEL